MRSAADMPEVGCPDFACAAARTESTRNCWPSSRSSLASIAVILGVTRIPLRLGYGPGMRVAVAFDHRGVRLRDTVLDALAGHSVIDLGTDTDAERIDYPDKAREVGEALGRGDAERAVFVC